MLLRPRLAAPALERHRPQLGCTPKTKDQCDKHHEWRPRQEREKRSTAEAEPLLDPLAELDAVLGEVDPVLNPPDRHDSTEGDGAKAMVPVPYHPTMKHDEYVKGAPALRGASPSQIHPLATCDH